MLVNMVVHLISIALLAFGGWALGSFLASLRPFEEYLRWAIPFALGGGVVGLLISYFLLSRPLRWIRGEMQQVPIHVIVAAIIGVIMGLIVSVLLALPLSMLPGLFGTFLPLGIALLLSYIGASIMAMRARDIFQMFAPTLAGPGVGTPWREIPEGEQILLDTSAIIDGRIADISQTGFVHGTLVIPRFVLDELRHIADSPDSLRRNRGRRGLDMLNKLQKESDVPVHISEVDFADTPEVDGKLVKLAKSLRCPIITNDFNLNRVAELQGVRVLNINELANAVKSVVLPGEEMGIRIIQEGKEAGQGVGFLDDGTMVVVEGGRRYLNSQLNIIVTRVLQTVAGRMIFAHPKLE